MWNRLLFISAVTWKTDRTWQYLSTIHFFLFHYYWLYLYSYSSCLSYFFILFHKFLPLGLLKLCTPTNTPSSTLSDTLILFNKCCFCPVFAYKAKKNKSFHDWVFSLTINLKLFFKIIFGAECLHDVTDDCVTGQLCSSTHLPYQPPAELWCLLSVTWHPTSSQRTSAQKLSHTKCSVVTSCRCIVSV